MLVPLGNILVVDDTPDNLRLLSTMLTDKGYKVRQALNGQMALTTVQRLPPDIILLDINMPGMNGYEVCEHLKLNEQTREIPVIFISALDDVADKVKAFRVGGADYITKPFQVEEVLARLEHQLTIQRQRQQLSEQNALLQQEIRDRQQAELALRVAQQKSETLLLNILPKAIAERLKRLEGSIAEHFDEVTVLFADLVGFTPLSSRLSPLELVNLLNKIFSTFDELTERHDLEKIKTIGDAYMVVGGLPVPNGDRAEAIPVGIASLHADMALDMLDSITQFQTDTGEPFQLRIGINTGPVVAGVIGIKKFIYDLWGDTVNVASRMESGGIPGKIQVTEETYKRLKDKYLFEKRGIISVKGKGEMMTYWLLGK